MGRARMEGVGKQYGILNWRKLRHPYRPSPPYGKLLAVCCFLALLFVYDHTFPWHLLRPPAHVAATAPSSARISASSATLVALGEDSGHDSRHSSTADTRPVGRASFIALICRCARFLAEYSILPSSLLRHQPLSDTDRAWVAALPGDEEGLAALCSGSESGVGGHGGSSDLPFASNGAAMGSNDSWAECRGGFHVQRVNAGYLVASELCARGWVWAPASELWPKGGASARLPLGHVPGVRPCSPSMPTLSWQISPERVKATVGDARAADAACVDAGNGPIEGHHRSKCARDGRGPVLANQLAGIGLTSKGTLWEILSGYSRARSPRCVGSIIGGLLPRTYRLYDEGECRQFFQQVSGATGPTVGEGSDRVQASIDEQGGVAGELTGNSALAVPVPGDGERWWIIKPVGKSGGRGVRLFVPRTQAPSTQTAGLPATHVAGAGMIAAHDAGSGKQVSRGEHSLAPSNMAGWLSSWWVPFSSPMPSGSDDNQLASDDDTSASTYKFKATRPLHARAPPPHPAALPGPLDAYDGGRKCRQVSLESTTVEVAQEYVRSPLLLLGRKFDIRVYAVVVRTAPLVAFYHTGQLRVSLVPFNDDPTDRFSHLTNSNVQKALFEDKGKDGRGGARLGDRVPKEDKGWAAQAGSMHGREAANIMFVDSSEKGSDQGDSWRGPSAADSSGGLGSAADGADAGGDNSQHHWSLDQLDRHLSHTGVAPPGVVAHTLVPRMKRAMVFALRAAAERMEPDPGLFQLFGFDFLVEDRSLRVRLLEVNRNPLLFPSSAVKLRTTPPLVRSTLDVVLALLERRLVTAGGGDEQGFDGDSSSGDGQGYLADGRVFPKDIPIGSLEPIIDGEWEFGNMDECS